jgi:hypothetical protein
MNRHVLLTAIVLGITAPGAAHAAQQAQLTPEQKEKLAKLEAIERDVQNAPPALSPQAAAKLDLEKTMRAKMAVEARTISNAPYFAEAVTESIQVLADGNRIARKTTTRIYRDSEGRTRREQVNDNGVVESVSIVDPVAHLSYVLQPESRTAYRDFALMAVPAMIRSKLEAVEVTGEKLSAAKAKLDLEQQRRQAPGHEGTIVYPDGPPPLPPPPPPPSGTEARMGFERTPAGQTVREDLGRQNIEGVAANGSRSTTTIPAGAIGNLQPLKIVSEQWVSPDLQVLVLTKHSDPRTGETTYRLQSIVRAEPDRSLFSVPPDYNRKESRIREPLMK